MGKLKEFVEVLKIIKQAGIWLKQIYHRNRIDCPAEFCQNGRWGPICKSRGHELPNLILNEEECSLILPSIHFNNDGYGGKVIALVEIINKKNGMICGRWEKKTEMKTRQEIKFKNIKIKLSNINYPEPKIEDFRVNLKLEPKKKKMCNKCKGKGYVLRDKKIELIFRRSKK